eukprot:Blabericola_migrator_1__3436@NODE_2010_length_3428_cov_136_110384_g1276_i0_p1_GENE_NODE_2010_length_3428_cov_136_110384_g1276_i0NODE_2010_length_3428_cov_136_110384_g1276_i0_p1_ORF_typecomplete_len715_score149_35AAA/PF00004_29/0_00029AAA/PF00004_29/4_3e38RuvB_N/PF05496_12/27RuvB_N/PF05496_12/2_2e10AAA_16/PF13191_6/0_017AAA_16/PF13191_6/0_031Rad17/PF03215_15/0_0014Rad17/PF03215_15/0_037AAA_5/PF07728_14/90AAA_5/PF07728_14/7_9e07AAA_22/PF13401_6/0_014AAA_22/PF13401_6/0_029Bac_DnaA/PF00308_18/3_2Bac
MVDTAWRIKIQEKLLELSTKYPSQPRPTAIALVRLLKESVPKGQRAPSDNILLQHVKTVYNELDAEKAKRVAEATPTRKRKLDRSDNDSPSKRSIGDGMYTETLNTLFTCSKPPSDVSLESLSGMIEVKGKLQTALATFTQSQPPINRARLLLVRGPGGSGRSHALRCLAGSLPSTNTNGSVIKYIQAKGIDFVSPPSSKPSTPSPCQSFVQLVEQSEPCLVTIDDLDIMAPSAGSTTHASNVSTTKERALFVAEFKEALWRLRDKQVLLVASSENGIDSQLFRAHLFDFEEINIPHQLKFESQREILESIIGQPNTVNWDQYASQLTGFQASDLAQLIEKAEWYDADRSVVWPNKPSPVSPVDGPPLVDLDEGGDPENPVALESDAETRDTSPVPHVLTHIPLSDEAVSHALRVIQPKVVKTGFYQTPTESFNSVGGLDNVIEYIKKKLVNRVTGVKLLPHLSTSTAMLFWGPPGCGKTLLAKATANACNVNFMVVNGSALHGRYVGESEGNVRQLFANARANAPCLIFCDECEVLFSKRSDEGNHEVTKKVVAAFLSEMAGVQARKDVYLIAATNYPDQIDEALLRPGRIEHRVYIPPPNIESRLAILKVLMGDDYIADDCVLQRVARASDRFSGADLKFLLEATIENAYETAVDLPSQKPYPLRWDHFEAALLLVEASLRKDQLCEYEKKRPQYDPVYQRELKLQDKATDV